MVHEKPREDMQGGKISTTQCSWANVLFTSTNTFFRSYSATDPTETRKGTLMDAHKGSRFLTDTESMQIKFPNQFKDVAIRYFWEGEGLEVQEHQLSERNVCSIASHKAAILLRYKGRNKAQ